MLMMMMMMMSVRGSTSGGAGVRHVLRDRAVASCAYLRLPYDRIRSGIQVSFFSHFYPDTLFVCLFVYRLSHPSTCIPGSRMSVVAIQTQMSFIIVTCL